MKSRVKAKTTIQVKTMAAVAKPSMPVVPKRHNGPGKTFHKDGHWIENPRKTSVLICTCGNKYLKTRHAQTKCLRCISLGK